MHADPQGTELLQALLAHLKSSHEAENRFNRDVIEGLRQEQDQIRNKRTALLDMRIDQSARSNMWSV